ncbi:unnamed protein product [Urochloa humidicola]
MRHDSDDDGDDHYDHPGRGGQTARKQHVRGRDIDTGRRERTRSPRRRDAEFRGDSRRTEREHRPSHTCVRTLSTSLPSNEELRAKSTSALQATLAAKAQALKSLVQEGQNGTGTVWAHEAADYINKAISLADMLGINAGNTSAATTTPRLVRNGAWSAVSEFLVPTSRVFTRIKTDTAPSVAEVEQALDKLKMFGDDTGVAAAATAPSAALPEQIPNNEDGLQQAQKEAQAPDPQEPNPEQATLETTAQQAATAATPQHRAATGPATACESLGLGAQMQESATLEAEAHGAPNAATADDLFVRPPPAILPTNPPRVQRQRRTFDMSAVRRSARLAKKPTQPAAQRAQRNLCRKLGISDDEFRPIEELLQEFIGMFTGPLPEHIMAAMTAVFDLDDDDAEEVNNALLHHANDAIDELQAEDQADTA